MTDNRLSKVRAEIEKYQKQIQAGAVDNRISKEKSEAYRICVKLISIIDSMLEEPTISLWHDKVEEPEPDKELICIGQFNNPLVLSSSSDSFRWNFILKWAYFDDLLKLSNVERNGKDLQEEPVSEDLEAEIKKAFLNNECSVTDAVSLSAFTRIARHFANWQKQQFEKNRLKHCDSITNEQAELEQGFIGQHLDKYQRMPTFLDAIEYGMRLQKQQMMKEAIEGGCFSYRNGYKHISCDIYDNHTDIKLGDKVKLIIIKED